MTKTFAFWSGVSLMNLMGERSVKTNSLGYVWDLEDVQTAFLKISGPKVLK